MNALARAAGALAAFLPVAIPASAARPMTIQDLLTAVRVTACRQATSRRVLGLLAAYELDYRVPVDQGLQLFTVLRRNDVPSEALVFPDEGHWVLKALNSKLWHETVFGWINKHLGS